MPNTNETNDDSPNIKLQSGSVKKDSIPKIKSFRSRVSKNIGLRQTKSGRTGSNRGGSPKRGRSAESVKNVPTNARRVVVKTRVIKTNTSYGKQAAKLHLKYIERDSAGADREEGELFNSESTNENPREWSKKRKEWINHTENEPHQFRMILSPEDGHDLNLTEYTRELMSRVEKDLGKQVKWTAANHYDTDNPHTHLVISGLDKNNKELRIDREYISHGFRNRSRELATQELGVKLSHDIDQTLDNEITKDRFTSLDRTIENKAYGNAVDLSTYPDAIPERKVRGRLLSRMDALVRFGLAEKTSGTGFILNDNWKQSLHELGDRSDVIKRMHRTIKTDLSKYHIFDGNSQTKPITGRLVTSGLHHELSDRYYMVIEENNGHAHYVKVDKSLNVSDYKRGSIVRVNSQPDTWLKKSDHTIETIARSNNDIYDLKEHTKLVLNNSKLAPDGVSADDYTNAISRRINRLVRFGLAQQIGTGRWAIEPALTNALKQKEIESPNQHITRVNVVDERSLNDQVKARGRAWVDTLVDQNNAPYSFGSEVTQAAKQRKEFLNKELGLKNDTPQLIKQLDRIEREDLVKGYINESSHRHDPLKQQQQTGTLQKKITAPSGRSYGIITTIQNNTRDQGFSLVPWRDNMARSLGKQVNYGLSQQNIPFVKSLSRGLQR